MTNKPPPIDSRTAADIVKQVQELLQQKYAPGWNEFDPVTGKPKGISAALIGVFARYAEIIIQRLNQVPNKNFLAFLNLLGASQLPPQPAKVPLLFFLAVGSEADAIVPVGTQVAAAPTEGEEEPVIFETERDLVVTAATLETVFVRDSEQDKYADYSEIAKISKTDTTTSTLEAPIFRGKQPVEHILKIGHRKLLGFPEIQNSTLTVSLTLTISLSKPLGDNAEVKWQMWDDEKWQDREPTEARLGAKNLRLQGDNQLTFAAITSVFASPEKASEIGWLRCVLKTAIAPKDQTLRQSGKVRSTELPKINAIKFSLSITRSSLAVEEAFTNQLPIDLSKQFFPFGEQPKFGDTFYLANQEVFSKPGATVTLEIDLIDPLLFLGLERETINKFKENQNPQLKWEVWDGQTQKWRAIGISRRDGSNPDELATAFQDQTNAFTNFGENRQISFTLQPSFIPQLTTVNGNENFWIRVRIIAGDYGKDARYQEVPGRYELIPASFVPPAIESLTVGYTLNTTELAPEKIITYNDFDEREIKLADNGTFAPFEPFEAIADNKPTLYLGFSLPVGRHFPNSPLSLFVQAADTRYREKLVPISPLRSNLVATPGTLVTHTFTLTNTSSANIRFDLSVFGLRQDNPWTSFEPLSLELQPGESRNVTISARIPANAQPNSSDLGILNLTKSDEPGITYSATFETVAKQNLGTNERVQLSWQYWNGKEWIHLTVRDDSENFTRSGLVEVLPPSNIAPLADFGLPERYWLRIRWESGEYDIEPRLRRILLNTTIASQTVTISNEILGSSNGAENQVFRTTRSPVLEGEYLEVREPEMPSSQERESIEKVFKEDAISLITDISERLQEIWVRWQQVPDFYGSGPRDRHYVLNRITGEIRFGDGLNGLIPPIGIGNLRLRKYQTGGGTIGNQPANTIVQLKTTVPYIDSVTNPEAATGGADAETIESLTERSPRTVRHSMRAVTLEDYEDLAMLATPEVARAKCVPLLNLHANPQDTNQSDQTPKAPGEVSVIIVPRSLDKKPLPSLDLLAGVQDYLETHAIATTKIWVVGPLYVEVSVIADIALTSPDGASTVAQAVNKTLTDFLHPLTGGFDGNGWTFGRLPHKSDFYALLEAVPGVDHVRSLNIQKIGEQDSVEKIQETGRFLVYSGTHTIKLLLEEV